MATKVKDPSAVALGNRRWAGSTKAERQAFARAGVAARNAKLTAERRREIAILASAAAKIARDAKKSGSSKSIRRKA